MYTILWSFQPDPARIAEFEQAYGPDGDWARLFRRGAGFLGTELLRDPAEPGRYLTADRWVSTEDYEAFRSAFQEQYEHLDRACEALTVSERLVGRFVGEEERPAPEKGQFRFAYFTPLYEETVGFYRDGLELPVFETWDRNLDDRGTVFTAASGMIEVLALPRPGASSHLWDERPPQGAFMVIEVPAVEDFHRRAVERGLPVTQDLKDQSWGHRSFCVREPNGLTLYLFTDDRIPSSQGRAQ